MLCRAPSIASSTTLVGASMKRCLVTLRTGIGRRMCDESLVNRRSAAGCSRSPVHIHMDVRGRLISVTTTAQSSSTSRPLPGHRPILPTPGCLHVVSVPIGCLRDITLRALDTLANVDVIVCEDVAVTRNLLTAYGIFNGNANDEHEPTTAQLPNGITRTQKQAPLLLAYTRSNANRLSVEVINRLRRGQAVALVSDAGTPCISDPGSYLVAQVRNAGMGLFPSSTSPLTPSASAAGASAVTVSPVPGACAAVAAISASGWDVHSHYVSGRARADTSGSGEAGGGGSSSGEGIRRRPSPFAAVAPSSLPSAPTAPTEAQASAASSPGFVFLGFLPPGDTAGHARRSSGGYRSRREELIAEIAGRCATAPGSSPALGSVAGVEGGGGIASRVIVLYVPSHAIGDTLAELAEACEGGDEGEGSETGSPTAAGTHTTADGGIPSVAPLSAPSSTPSSAPEAAAATAAGWQRRIKAGSKKHKAAMAGAVTAPVGHASSPSAPHGSGAVSSVRRPVMVFRELTKAHEEGGREYGSLREAADDYARAKLAMAPPSQQASAVAAAAGKEKARGGLPTSRAVTMVQADDEVASMQGQHCSASSTAGVRPVPDLRGEFTVLIGPAVHTR